LSKGFDRLSPNGVASRSNFSGTVRTELVEVPVAQRDQGFLRQAQDDRKLNPNGHPGPFYLLALKVVKMRV
jgi:hypothetical protein